jgi:hypothetical protein
MIIVALNLVPKFFKFNFVLLETLNQDSLLGVGLILPATSLAILGLCYNFKAELQAKLLELI